ncbi:MAG: cytochrome c [Nitrospirae bacterium]|nr:cytochrome c [Nitrospirota bacterium]
MRKSLFVPLLMIALLLGAMSTAYADGAALYDQYCSGCHGPLATSSKLGKTAAEITAAINGGIPAMAGLSFLSAADIQAIANALAPAPPPPPPPASLSLSLSPSSLPAGTQGTPYSQNVTMSATGGSSPYTFSCSGSGVAGLTAAASGAVCNISGTPTAGGTYTVNFAATDSAGANASAARSFSVNTSTPPPSGADTTPPVVTAFLIPRTSGSLTIRIIAFSATDNVGVTGYLLTETPSSPRALNAGWNATPPRTYTFTSMGAKTLYAWAKDDAGNISGVAKATTLITGSSTPPPGPVPPPTRTPPPPTDGTSLYNQYCSSCHGPLASSSKLGRTAAQITAAINGGVPAMAGLSTLTSAQIQAIADALGGSSSTPPPLPTDGASLYNQLCSSCHGPLASSSVRGESAGEITDAIRSVSQMAGFSTLTSAQIQAIAGALAGGGGSDDDSMSAQSAGTMPVPTGQDVFAYPATASPSRSNNPAAAMPLGVGPAATGGDEVKVQVSLGAFAAPVDVYVTIYGPSAAGIFGSFDIYYLQDNSFVAMGQDILPWKSGVTDANGLIIDVPTTQLPSGPYVMVLMATPTGKQDSYYRWITSFVIP